MSTATPAEILEWALSLLPDRDLERHNPPPKELVDVIRQGYGFVTGKKEGIELGRSEGLETLRNVLIDFLAARGIVLEDSARARIEQCSDAATLARWCTRAASFTAGSLDEQLV